ncbi:hypothetical protein [Lentimicrobium sp. S6]|uniref:hypothetical protein n=1 Tax=Lentimicrobium sp. S6 TaxID=2735872 RepID=UPI001551A848|nr:hypothetical protein [Lentimicrobium sp. S6]NPD48205.1 hypothetical protein [Lentimicrobium sp. S6]
MKKISLLFMALTFISISGHCQFLTNKKNIEIERLADTLKIVSYKNDLLQKLVDNYGAIYLAFKEKFIKQDFDPNRSAALLDSLIAMVDSTDEHLLMRNQIMYDSLIQLNRTNEQLLKRTDSLISHQQYVENHVVYIEIEKAEAIENLKKLKELFDDEIINQAEFIRLKQKYLDRL